MSGRTAQTLSLIHIFVCGNGDRKAILDNVLKLLDGHERIVAIAPHAKGERFEELPVERFETHTRCV